MRSRIAIVCLFLLRSTVAHAQTTLIPSEATLLLGSDPWENEQWGTSVASSADGQRVVVGSAMEGARIFVRSGDDFVLEREIRPTSPRDGMGRAVAMSADGRMVAIGAPRRDGTGTVRVLARDEAGWHLDAELRSFTSRDGDRFGSAVALSGDGERLFVGAPYARVGGTPGGRVVVFARRAIGWVERATLVRTMPASGDGFGWAVAASADGSVVLVGARAAGREGVRGAGLALVHTLDAEGRVVDRVELARPPVSESFGASVALSADGGCALVGAPRALTDTGGLNAGAAYVYERDEAGWAQRVRLVGHHPSDLLGSSVAMTADGTLAFAGAPRVGRVRWLGRSDAGWSEATALEPAASEVTDRSGFGTSVAVSADGHLVVIGAPNVEVEGRRSGVAHVVSLAPPGARPARVVDVAPRFDLATRAELARPHRTVTEDGEIQIAGAVTMAGGVAGVVGGVVLMLAGALSNRSCPYTFIFPSCTYRTDFGFVAAGAVASSLGAALLIAGGAIFSQRQQGPLHPRFAVAPTADGALAAMSLVF